ncbi:TPA: transcription elongation factor GreA [Candidatus Falkowbacteria bacterium]|nr:transcription elongation factor GreA [Candidatus Falkowbacteria bacterium]
MQIPKRKSEQNVRRAQTDTLMTREKYDQLVAELEKMEKKIQPRLAEEVLRLAQFGDFSENAAYQIAKGKLRGLNQRILNIKNLINHAEIIEPNENTERIQLGHEVTIDVHGETKKYRLLGFHETDPAAGIISTTSPLGASLLGKKVGDKVSILLANGKTMEFTIAKIV